MSAWAIALAIIVGLVTNEIFEITPWIAQRVVRLAARWWTADHEAAAAYEAEWRALIEERPGKLLKLWTAFGFLAGAGWRAAPQLVARMRKRLDRPVPVPLQFDRDRQRVRRRPNPPLIIVALLVVSTILALAAAFQQIWTGTMDLGLVAFATAGLLSVRVCFSSASRRRRRRWIRRKIDMLQVGHEEWGTATEIATRLGPDVTPAMVRRWHDRHGLTGVRDGRTVRFPLSEAAEIERDVRHGGRGRRRAA